MTSKQASILGTNYSSWETVLKAIPPSFIWTIAQYFLILELADRKWESQKIYQKQNCPKESQALDELTNAWIKIMAFLLGILTALLKTIFYLFYFIRFIRKPCKQAIETIEASLLKKNDAIKRKCSVERVKTVDELLAEKGLKQYENIIDMLHKNNKEDFDILAYINLFHSSAMAIGQRWAVAELECRITESTQDRTEALWRGSFMIRAFGFGTLKLIRRLLAILAIAMALPFLVNIFVADTPNYSILANLAQGVGWTAILWAITLALTLFLNDRRMLKIWKRAKLASLMAQRTRSEELIAVFYEVKNAITSCISPLIKDIKDDVIKLLILDNLNQIDEQIKREEMNLKKASEQIEALKKHLKLSEKIKQLLDTSSQGDAIDQVGNQIENIF